MLLDLEENKLVLFKIFSPARGEAMCTTLDFTLTTKSDNIVCVFSREYTSRVSAN